MKSYHGSEKTGHANSRKIIVLDASVVAKWILPGEPWESQALELKNKLTKGEIDVHEPSLLAHELANLLLRAVDKGRISLNDAISALKILGKLGLKLHEINLDRASELMKNAKILNLTAYDVAYVLLAKELRALLISADEELCTKAKRIVATKHLKEV